MVLVRLSFYLFFITRNGAIYFIYTTRHLLNSRYLRVPGDERCVDRPAQGTVIFVKTGGFESFSQESNLQPLVLTNLSPNDDKLGIRMTAGDLLLTFWNKTGPTHYTYARSVGPNTMFFSTLHLIPHENLLAAFEPASMALFR